MSGGGLDARATGSTPSSAPSLAPPDPSSREPVIRARPVKRFGDQVVLDGVDLDVMPGETVVIMGGSGSGKTTMLRHLIESAAARRRIDQGLGKDLATLDDEGMNGVRRRFGILFQSGALFNSMTLAENVALPLQEHTQLDQGIIDIQVKIKLQLVGLREHADKFPAQISGGMKKRAGLARALSLDPALLFYDEPSAGLDPVTSAEIDQLILDLSRKLGVTSVVVTHEMDSAFTVADRMAMFDKGRMLKVAPRAEFERLRALSREEIAKLPVDDQIVHQFVRGDPIGPITERKEATDYAEDLLGEVPHATQRAPSVEATRIA
ncbi:MAG: ATP-binding cassette domain-containing protein [Phycisphaerales bacterium]